MRDGLGGVASVAVIGGTSDIGLAIARELTKLGATRIVLVGRDSEAMRSASPDLPVKLLVDLDVCESGDYQTAVDTMFGDGDIDVVVLAAGVLHTDPSPEQVSEMARINGGGPISLLARIGEKLRSQGHGHLVVLSSMAVVRPRPSNYWYGASKAGLDFASKGLSDDLGRSGVQVSTVRPGFVHTRMTEGMRPAPLSCHPEDVAMAVRAVVQDRRGGVLWVPSALKYLAFIIRLLPSNLLRRLDR